MDVNALPTKYAHPSYDKGTHGYTISVVDLDMVNLILKQNDASLTLTGQAEPMDVDVGVGLNQLDNILSILRSEEVVASCAGEDGGS
ncbi:hypothetical protein CTI12_AA456080 [Artemisia annua]|uniref:Uncharacterized protein n=1 Tax=Artemisia annua TaxID=35608 RepID=A0A2U1LTD8_ARTAN|nr:hypothetical protein CTI12_AA456080 [Artemisia annua]